MFLDYWPLSWLQTFVCFICLYIIRYAYWQCTTGARLRQLATRNGCQPLKRFKDWEFLYGIDLILKLYKAMQAHKALEFTQQRFEEIGARTGRTRFMGMNVIATIEPENIKTILATDFDSYSLGDNRKKLMTPLLGKGIFTTDGPAWQHSRDMLRPNFARTQISGENMAIFERHVRNMIRAIPKDGSTTVDLHDLFFAMSLDIATEFLFGESVGLLQGGDEKRDEKTNEFVEAFQYAQDTMEGSMEREWGILGLFLPDKKFRRSCATVHAFVDSLIERAAVNQAKYEASKASDSTNHRYVFLHELLTQTSSISTVRSELLNILLAGRDTTASLLTNMFFTLSKSPDIYSRLQTEIASAFNDNDKNGDDDSPYPTFEQLKSLKYLRAVINESLRFHPVVPENGRQAETDTVLPLGGGENEDAPVLVKKGTIVAYHLYVMHRRKDLFGEDADVFRPERWIDGEGGGEDGKGLRVGWEFLPFNGGPRICIGQQFALTETAYVTVRLLQEFSNMESKDPEPWREKFNLTCTSFGGCKVVMTPRV